MYAPSINARIMRYGLANAMRLISTRSCASGVFDDLHDDEQDLSFFTAFNSKRVAEAVCEYLELDAYDSPGDEIKRAFFAFVQGKTVAKLPHCFCKVLDEAIAQANDLRDDSLEAFYRDGVGKFATAYNLPARDFVDSEGFFSMNFEFEADIDDENEDWFRKRQRASRDKLAVYQATMPLRAKLNDDCLSRVRSFLSPLFLSPLDANESAFYERLYKTFRVTHPVEMRALSRRLKPRGTCGLGKHVASAAVQSAGKRAKSLSALGVSGGASLSSSIEVHLNVGGAKRAGTDSPNRLVVPRLEAPPQELELDLALAAVSLAAQPEPASPIALRVLRADSPFVQTSVQDAVWSVGGVPLLVGEARAVDDGALEHLRHGRLVWSAENSAFAQQSRAPFAPRKARLSFLSDEDCEASSDCWGETLAGSWGDILARPSATRLPVQAEESPMMAALKRMLTLPERTRPLEYMHMDDLRKILRRHLLAVCGTKAELIARIEHNDGVELRLLFVDVPRLKLDPENHAEQTYEAVLAAVTQDGLELRNAAPRWRKTAEIVWAATRQIHTAFKWASHSCFQKDVPNALKAVGINGHCLQHLSHVMRETKEVIMAAVEKTPDALQWARVRDDETMLRVLTVPGYGNAIELGTPVQRGFADAAGVVHLELARAAVANSSDGWAVSYLSPFAREELKFAAVSAQGEALKHFLVRNTRWAMEYDSASCNVAECNDRALVQAAVTQDGLALKHASEALRSDVGLVSTAVAGNPFALNFAGRVVKSNPEVALVAASKSYAAVEQAKTHHIPAELHRLAVAKAKEFAHAAYAVFCEGASAWKVSKETGQLEFKEAPAQLPLARRLSAHNPYFYKKFTNLIGSFLGDPTGEKTASLRMSAYNIRYLNVLTASADEVQAMLRKRVVVQRVFKEACALAGFARFEGCAADFSGMSPSGEPLPRLFTAAERLQVLTYLAQSKNLVDEAPIVAAFLRAGFVPPVARVAALTVSDQWVERC